MNYSHFSSLGYREVTHDSARMVNPAVAKRASEKEDVLQKEREEAERRANEKRANEVEEHNRTQLMIQQERNRRQASAGMEMLREGFSKTFGWYNDPSSGHFIDLKGTNIIDLTGKSLEIVRQNINSGKALVWFYAEWCGHCKHMIQPWLDLDRMLGTSATKLIMVEDKSDSSEIVRAYGISGFPTVKYFSPENPQGEEYGGKRNATDLLKFIKSK